MILAARCAEQAQLDAAAGGYLRISRWSRCSGEYQNLMSARLKLEAKLTTIKQEREELEALLELAKSKEITAKTMKSLDDLSGVGDADVARIADSIRQRLDRASAEGEMRAASLDKQMDDGAGQRRVGRSVDRSQGALGSVCSSRDERSHGDTLTRSLRATEVSHGISSR